MTELQPHHVGKADKKFSLIRSLVLLQFLLAVMSQREAGRLTRHSHRLHVNPKPDSSKIKVLHDKYKRKVIDQ